MKRNGIAGILAAVLLSAWSLPAGAEETYKLDPVLVTAEKRTENVQDVPVSVTAISEQQIKDSGIRSIQDVFEHTAPEMIADTAVDGIILTGGGALTYGMKNMLEQRLFTKINLVDDPENSVVRGLGRALSDFSMLKNHDYHFRSLEDLMVE